MASDFAASYGSLKYSSGMSGMYCLTFVSLISTGPPHSPRECLTQDSTLRRAYSGATLWR